MNIKYLITIVIIIFLIACSQEPEETVKTSEGMVDTQLKQVPEVNDTNCRFEYIKTIEDKRIQQTLADNCARRNTLKPTVHKPWTLR